MEAICLIDFGSTNTKVTAVDPIEERILARATAFTTVETDIGEGLANALSLLQKEVENLKIVKRFACSSAAGGLRMIASGLVPALTAEAARLAALGAGAKVVGLYSYELTEEDITEIVKLKPDIFLLTGGVDGGNKECILHNAKLLSSMNIEKKFPILIAGNRSAQSECEKILSNFEVVRCPNVLPKLEKLNIEPTQEQIRRIFLERIIHARGLSREKELISGILMPTPSAVKSALELLSSGTKAQAGFGELVAVDLGGATTDVYSIADGLPKGVDVVLKGIPEPFSKRTVEGDIGMRYSAIGVLDAVGAERLSQISGLSTKEVETRAHNLNANPDLLPQNKDDENMDFALASSAVETAVERHAGTIEEVYTPTGLVYIQTGKDLRTVNRLVLTGGAVIHNPRAEEIASYARYSKGKPAYLKPLAEEIYVDKAYILAAMGLLAESLPETALKIMKKEIKRYGN